MSWEGISDSLSALLMLAGGFFALVSAVGMLRMPDFFTRLHAAGIADTLTVMLVVSGLVLHAGLSLISTKLILILFFILFTTPTATHALAKAALHGGLKPVVGKQGDDP
ncbi:MAG: monovalent cation/H(+) antiporter subunit G [Gammaproteobacteria bacterium]